MQQNVKSWFKSWVISFTFQAYTLRHTLNCVCVSLFRFHIWILKQFYHCPKLPALPRHIKYKFHLNYLEHSIFISLDLRLRKERLLTFPFAIWDGMTIFEVPAYLRIGVSSGCTCQLQMVTLFYDYRHALQE